MVTATPGQWPHTHTRQCQRPRSESPVEPRAKSERAPACRADLHLHACHATLTPHRRQADRFFRSSRSLESTLASSFTLHAPHTGRRRPDPTCSGPSGVGGCRTPGARRAASRGLRRPEFGREEGGRNRSTAHVRRTCLSRRDRAGGAVLTGDGVTVTCRVVPWQIGEAVVGGGGAAAPSVDY